jgi:hypothetical protein
MQQLIPVFQCFEPLLTDKFTFACVCVPKPNYFSLKRPNAKPKISPKKISPKTIAKNIFIMVTLSLLVA